MASTSGGELGSWGINRLSKLLVAFPKRQDRERSEHESASQYEKNRRQIHQTLKDGRGF